MPYFYYYSMLLAAASTAKAHSWLTCSLSSTRPIKLFSAKLFLGLYCSKVGFHPRCGTWHLSLLNFIKLLLALPYSLSRSLKGGSAFKHLDWFLQFGIICKLRASPPSSPPDHCQRYSLTGVRIDPCGTQLILRTYPSGTSKLWALNKQTGFQGTRLQV